MLGSQSLRSKRCVEATYIAADAKARTGKTTDILTISIFIRAKASLAAVTRHKHRGRMRLKRRFSNGNSGKVRNDPATALVREQLKAVKRKLEEIHREYQDIVRELDRRVRSK